MIGLLVDYNVIPGRLLKKIKNIPKNKINLGIIFIIRKNIFENLKRKNFGKDRINFINSENFILNIIEYYFVYCGEKCKIVDEIKQSHIKIVEDTLSKYLPSVPIISTKKCRLTFMLDKPTTLYLKSLINKPTEFSGAFVIKNIKNKNVFELQVDKNNMVSGEEEGVDAVHFRYNYHTHPKKAYENNDVVNGWPSVHDYISILELKNTIVHLVITIEGIYIISYGKNWSGKNTEKLREFINKNYDIDHEEDISIYEYIEHINSLVYNKKKVFNVEYLPWSKSNNIFSIYCSEIIGTKCLEKDIRMYYGS